MLFRWLVIAPILGILLLLIVHLCKREYDWRQYKKKTATWMRDNGRSNVRLGTGVADGGRDVKGKKDGKRWYVQCKMYGQKSKVTVSQVREIGFVANIHNAKAMIVTSGKLTRQARELANSAGIIIKELSK